MANSLTQSTIRKEIVMAPRKAKASTKESSEKTVKLPAVLVEPVPANSQLLKKLKLPVTKTIDEHTQAIKDRFEGQARSAVEIALLIGVAKTKYFSDDYEGWIIWGKEQFAFSKRYCNQLAKACGFLVGRVDEQPDLLTTDIDKIYQIARLPEDAQAEILTENPDFFEQDRKAVRQLVKDKREKTSSTPQRTTSKRGRRPGIFSTSRKHLRALQNSVKDHKRLLALVEKIRAEMDKIEAVERERQE